jgi:hypothetical protein
LRPRLCVRRSGIHPELKDDARSTDRELRPEADINFGDVEEASHAELNACVRPKAVQLIRVRAADLIDRRDVHRYRTRFRVIARPARDLDQRPARNDGGLRAKNRPERAQWRRADGRLLLSRRALRLCLTDGERPHRRRHRRARSFDWSKRRSASTKGAAHDPGRARYRAALGRVERAASSSRFRCGRRSRRRARARGSCTTCSGARQHAASASPGAARPRSSAAARSSSALDDRS